MISKYLVYAIILLLVLFALEFFRIVDIPYFALPDFFSGKEELLHRSMDAVKEMD